MKYGPEATMRATGALLEEGRKGHIDFAGIDGVYNNELSVDCVRRCLRGRKLRSEFRVLGTAKNAMTLAAGTSSCSKASRFATDSTLNQLMPVTLPPGRLRLDTKPTSTGSCPLLKTIGIDVVAALAASPDSTVPVAAMTLTWRLNQIGGERGQLARVAVRPPVFDGNILALDISKFTQSPPKRCWEESESIS